MRTLQRIFINDLGVDLDTWRRQLRLTKAIEFIVAGNSIKQVAYAVGYRQPSAFVSAFRRTFGLVQKPGWINFVGPNLTGTRTDCLHLPRLLLRLA